MTVVTFSESEKEKARNSFNLMSKQALRVLAFAERSLDDVAVGDMSEQADQKLVWIGSGHDDPPRADVASDQ